MVVVGGKKPEFKETFELGTKIDPTIYQFRDINPRLNELGRKIVFNSDYPRIYDPWFGG